MCIKNSAKNYFFAGVPRPTLTAMLIAQDHIIRTRLDVTVHQTCVLVCRIVITLRHSSKSVFLNERMEKTRFDSFQPCCAHFGTSRHATRFILQVRVCIRKRKLT